MCGTVLYGPRSERFIESVANRRRDGDVLDMKLIGVNWHEVFEPDMD